LGYFSIRFQAFAYHSFKCLIAPYEIEYNLTRYD